MNIILHFICFFYILCKKRSLYQSVFLHIILCIQSYVIFLYKIILIKHCILYNHGDLVY